MITTINEFRQSINEVRLPHGFFKVTATFSLPDGEWDMMFNQDSIIEIDTEYKYIKKWSRKYNNATGASSGGWLSKDFNYYALQQPALYAEFKANTYRLPAEETPSFAVKAPAKEVQFTTKVKAFAKKAAEAGLGADDKVKVVAI